MELYQAFANKRPTLIIRALRDDMVGLTRVNEIIDANHLDLSASHNFIGESRHLMIAAVRNFLN